MEALDATIRELVESDLGSELLRLTNGGSRDRRRLLAILVARLPT
jgi:hypothetical protein